MHKDRRIITEILFALHQLYEELPSLCTKDVLYYTDFNLIHPFIYTQTQDRYRYTDAFGSCIFKLHSKYNLPSNIKICLSLPAAIEFVYSLQKQKNFFDKHAHDNKFSEYVFGCLNDLKTGRLQVSEIKSEQVKRFIITSLDSRDLDDRVLSFVALINKHKIDMLTDYYSPRTINKLISSNQKILNEIRENIKIDRSRHDKRFEIDKNISYKVDTHNTFLPMLNNVTDSTCVNFVCSNRFQNWAPNSILKSHFRDP